MQRSDITLNVLCALPMCLSLFLPDSLIRKPLVLLPSPQPSQERHILRIIQCIAFTDELLPLSDASKFLPCLSMALEFISFQC